MATEASTDSRTDLSSATVASCVARGMGQNALCGPTHRAHSRQKAAAEYRLGCCVAIGIAVVWPVLRLAGARDAGRSAYRRKGWTAFTAAVASLHAQWRSLCPCLLRRRALLNHRASGHEKPSTNRCSRLRSGPPAVARAVRERPEAPGRPAYGSSGQPCIRKVAGQAR
jgi:hypothetical protein